MFMGDPYQLRMNSEGTDLSHLEAVRRCRVYLRRRVLPKSTYIFSKRHAEFEKWIGLAGFK